MSRISTLPAGTFGCRGLHSARRRSSIAGGSLMSLSLRARVVSRWVPGHSSVLPFVGAASTTGTLMTMP